MHDGEHYSAEELRSFLETAAYIGGASTIIHDGIRYVDRASFWKWLKDTYSNAMVGGIDDWMALYPKQFEQMLRTKGLEWDIFRDYHPHFVDINNLSPDYSDRIKDLQSFNPFSGELISIQVKAPISESGIRESAIRLFTYPPDTKFAVTQSVYEEAIGRGMPPDRFVKVVPDDSVVTNAKDRLSDATQGNIDYGVTPNGALNEIGNGALIGAAVYVGLSALRNYSGYRTGTMTFEDFSQHLMKDGLKGGIIGGSMSAINIGVQYAATAVGCGAPITIPVMLIIGAGLRKFIDPMFGDGEWADNLRTMKYSHSLQDGWYNFGLLSTALFDKQEQLHGFQIRHSERALLLNSFSSLLDDAIDSELQKD